MRPAGLAGSPACTLVARRLTCNRVMARVSPHEGACWSAARRPAWTSPLASAVTIWTARYRRDDDLAYGTRFRALSGIVVQPVAATPPPPLGKILSGVAASPRGHSRADCVHPQPRDEGHRDRRPGRGLPLSAKRLDEGTQRLFDSLGYVGRRSRDELRRHGTQETLEPRKVLDVSVHRWKPKTVAPVLVTGISRRRNRRLMLCPPTPFPPRVWGSGASRASPPAGLMPAFRACSPPRAIGRRAALDEPENGADGRDQPASFGGTCAGDRRRRGQRAGHGAAD